MNALEHQLDYPFADTLPAAGDAFEVAPGVRWLRMPLPFSLDHINLWLLRDEIDGQAAGPSSTAGSRRTRFASTGNGSSTLISTACRCCA